MLDDPTAIAMRSAVPQHQGAVDEQAWTQAPQPQEERSQPRQAPQRLRAVAQGRDPHGVPPCCFSEGDFGGRYPVEVGRAEPLDDLDAQIRRCLLDAAAP